jgi:hypothetical protein
MKADGITCRSQATGPYNNMHHTKRIYFLHKQRDYFAEEHEGPDAVTLQGRIPTALYLTNEWAVSIVYRPCREPWA